MVLTGKWVRYFKGIQIISQFPKYVTLGVFLLFAMSANAVRAERETVSRMRSKPVDKN